MIAYNDFGEYFDRDMLDIDHCDDNSANVDDIDDHCKNYYCEIQFWLNTLNAKTFENNLTFVFLPAQDIRVSIFIMYITKTCSNYFLDKISVTLKWMSSRSPRKTV